MKALSQATVSDSNDLDDLEATTDLNEDITVREFKGGVVDIYDHTHDTGVTLRPEEVKVLRLFLEGI